MVNPLRSHKGSLALTALLLGVCIGWVIKPCPSAKLAAPTVIRDSVLIPVPQPPTVVEVKPRESRVRLRRTVHTVDTVIAKEVDTLFLSPAFTSVDSNRVMESGDTLRRVSFQYPENVFAYDFRPRPDSMKIIEKIIIQPVSSIGSSDGRPLWVDILTHGVAFVVGGYATAQVIQ